jgi:hypothetical protein
VKEKEDEQSKPFPHIEIIQEGELSLSELEEVLDIMAEHLFFQQAEINLKNNTSTRKGL